MMATGTANPTATNSTTSTTTSHSVERTDSQKSQNNGPRVSFNRDVHVKRIGLRPNETQLYPPTHQTIHASHIQAPQLRRELPNDLSKEEILKEAALVLSQAERVKCTTDTDDVRPVPKSRRKKESTSVEFHSLPTRRKNAKALGRSISDASAKKSKKPSIFNIFSSKNTTDSSQTNVDKQKSPDNQWKKVKRSKSDVGTAKKRIEIDKEDILNGSKKKTIPLSPIIENPPQKNYFSPKHTALQGNIGYTNQNDLDLVPSKSTVDSPIRQSFDQLHSSQMPAEKLPLTKGRTVDGMVKRLSMERYSPVPHLQTPAFSYTRPNDNRIIYAQVMGIDNVDGTGTTKQTFHSSFPVKRTPTKEVDSNRHSSQRIVESQNGFNSSNQKIHDVSSHSNTNVLYKDIAKHERSLSPVQHLNGARKSMEYQNYRRPSERRTNSDEDEGLGYELRREYDEPPIVPVIRDFASPVRIQLDGSHRGNADGVDTVDRYQEPFPEFNKLSNRRKQLESRMFSRRIGSAEHIPHKDRVVARETDATTKYLRSRSNELLSSPTEQKIYPKFDSMQLLNKYSPERYHLDMTTSPARDISNAKYENFVVRKRFDSPKRVTKEIDLGYIDSSPFYNKHSISYPHIDPDSSYFQEKYRQESQPKSLDSHFSDRNHAASEPREIFYPAVQYPNYRNEFPDSGELKGNAFHSLARTKKQQRSFDKGDSGIEHDYRKDSFNEDTRRKRRTYQDDIRATDMFLKRERQHSEKLHVKRFVPSFRERSIDDGSHFDPRLDKYPMKYKTEKGTTTDKTDTMKSEKKFSSLKKVKQLFSGPSKKTGVADPKPVRDKYMVREDEMRQRYKEYKGNGVSILREPTIIPNTPATKDDVRQNVLRSASPYRGGVQKNLRFFGDTDLESNASISKAATFGKVRKSQTPALSLARTQKYSQSAYDLNTMPKKPDLDHVSPKRTTVSSKFRSTSLQNLKKEPDIGVGQRYESSRQLHDISESASDNECERDSPLKRISRSSPARGEHSATRYRSETQNMSTSYDDRLLDRGRSRERSPKFSSSKQISAGTVDPNEYRKPPTGPQKPARSMDRRKTMSREREHVVDSSGTEGESSQQSQRSVVYLHATTVGAIPQPSYALRRAGGSSREELSSIKSSSVASKQLQPMTRTVSRSVSVLAPWKPKHVHEGYEINYSQNAEQQNKTLPKSSRKDRSSSLNRVHYRKHNIATNTPRTDVTVTRNSSLTSNSTATLPSRNKDRDFRKDTPIVASGLGAPPLLVKQRQKEMVPSFGTGGTAATAAPRPTPRRRWND